MTTNDDEKIQQLVETLEQLVPRETARLGLNQYDRKTGHLISVGNRNGYLRFGIEFLKAAMAKPKNSETGRWPVLLDWKYLMLQGSEGFGEFFRDDALASGPTYADPIVNPTRKMLILMTGCLFLLGIVGLALIGIIAICRWVFSL